MKSCLEPSTHWDNCSRTILFDQAGLKLELEELLGCDVDVISVGGLKDKHRGILADAISL